MIILVRSGPIVDTRNQDIKRNVHRENFLDIHELTPLQYFSFCNSEFFQAPISSYKKKPNWIHVHFVSILKYYENLPVEIEID